jgi:hypothetical protein
MELDSGDEDLQKFLNNQYFMMQQMLPTPASPIDVTNDLPIQGCAPPAGSLSVLFQADRSSDSEDSDSDSTCSDHSSCQIPGGCNPDKIDKTTSLCPLHAPHDCGSTCVVKLSDMNTMVPSRVARGLVTLLSTDLHEQRYKLLLDTGASINVALPHLLHNIRSKVCLVNSCGETDTQFRQAGDLIFIHPDVGFLAIEAYVGKPLHLASKTYATLGVSALTALNVDVNYHMIASRADHRLKHQQGKQFIPNMDIINKTGELIEGRWHGAYDKHVYGHRSIVDTACGRRTMAMVENMTLK